MSYVKQGEGNQGRMIAPLTREHTGYKANLLQNARYQMRQTGGFVIVRGRGNQTHVSFYNSDGQNCTVWFPVESRVHDLEIADLKDAIECMSGHKAFTLK